MHIITIDDQDFPAVLDLFQKSKLVAQYMMNGRIQLVRANKRLVMVSPSNTPETIAIKPDRSEKEAHKLAEELLAIERTRITSEQE